MRKARLDTTGGHRLLVDAVMHRNHQLQLFCLAALTATSGVAAGFPVPRAEPAAIVVLNPPRLWQKVECRLEGAPVAANNFDPDQIRIDATVTTPAGRPLTVPAYWHQDFSRALTDGREVLTPAGSPHWRVRFTPTEAGAHRVEVRVALAGAPARKLGESVVDVPASPVSDRRGWVRVAPDRRWLETADGRPLRLVGENVCWDSGRGTFEFEEWFEAMAASGQNFARLWFSPWSIALEQEPGTLNNYRLEGAWKLDRIFATAERLGIYLMPALDYHGMFQVASYDGTNNRWATDNPYSAALGGPCATPNDFFTSPAARRLYEKRLRYLVARYGGSPNLLAWQFFNEIDNPVGPGGLDRGAVVAWHRDMGRTLRSIDPWRHLVTTSLHGGADWPELWTLPELDFTSYHGYGEPAPARRLAAMARDHVTRYGKPVLVGEFGISSTGWDIGADPYLRGFRQGVWGGALGGSVGTGMSWWWQHIHEDGAYTLYAALVRVLGEAGWFDGQWTPIDFPVGASSPPALGEQAPDGAVFSVRLPLDGVWGSNRPNAFAVTDPLGAERASEFLSSFVQGRRNARLGRPMRLSAWFAQGARLVMRVNAVALGAELVVAIDGGEVLRAAIPDIDGLTATNGEINREFSVAVPAGRHVVEIRNDGTDWMFLDWVRMENLLPSAGGAPLRAEAVGLRQDPGRAVLYVVSPWAVHPAGARRYHLPVVSDEAVALPGWPEGCFTARWHDPRTGAVVGATEGRTKDGQLVLALPEFREDLAAVVEPAVGAFATGR